MDRRKGGLHMEEHGTVKGRRRHVFVWKALRPLAKLICWIKFGFTCEKRMSKARICS